MDSKSNFGDLLGSERIEKCIREERLEDAGPGKIVEEVIHGLNKAMELEKDKTGLILHYLEQVQETGKLPATLMERVIAEFTPLYEMNLCLMKPKVTLLQKMTGLKPDNDPIVDSTKLTVSQLRLLVEMVKGTTETAHLNQVVKALVEHALNSGLPGGHQEKLEAIAHLLATELKSSKANE